MRILITLAFIVAAGAAGIILWPAPKPVPDHAWFASQGAGPAPGPVDVIAHGSGQVTWPPNTLQALQAAVVNGATVLEVDIRRTRDGVLILRNDATLERTTNIDGAIAELDWAEVSLADAGANAVAGRDFSGQGLRIPTLEEALAQFPEARWQLEIKPDDADVAAQVCAVIRARGLEQTALVASFHDDALNAFRAECPEVATSMAQREATRFAVAARLGLSRFVPVHGGVLQLPEEGAGLDLTTPRLIAAAHQRGLRVHYWTIDDGETAQVLRARGADGFITNDVAAVVSAFATP